MRFQVGKFTAEFKLGDSGQLQVLWSPYRPCYLNRGEREQYRAARAAFLESLKPGHDAASPPSPGEASAKDRTSGLAIAVLLAGLLAGCARGGGIGLEAVVADGLCEQQGFHLGTPEYGSSVHA